MLLSIFRRISVLQDGYSVLRYLDCRGIYLSTLMENVQEDAKLKCISIGRQKSRGKKGEHTWEKLGIFFGFWTRRGCKGFRARGVDASDLID